MWPAVIVVGSPVLDDLTSLTQRAEQVLVETLVPKPADEALGERNLHRFAGPNVVPFNRPVLRSGEDGSRRERGNIVADNHAGAGSGTSTSTPSGGACAQPASASRIARTCSDIAPGASRRTTRRPNCQGCWQRPGWFQKSRDGCRNWSSCAAGSGGLPQNSRKRPLDRKRNNLQVLEINGEPDRVRTCDLLIKSQLLYQLSYGPAP